MAVVHVRLRITYPRCQFRTGEAADPRRTRTQTSRDHDYPPQAVDQIASSDDHDGTDGGHRQQHHGGVDYQDVRGKSEDRVERRTHTVSLGQHLHRQHGRLL